MKKKIVFNAIVGMGFGFPVTLLCMILFGGFHEVIREFLVWLVASALYGMLSGVLFDRERDLHQIVAIAIHFVGCTAITMGAALVNGYVTGIADVLPILIPVFVIYAVISLICIWLNKQTEKRINKALEDK